MESNNNKNLDIDSKEIQFLPGNQIEIYFPEEKTQYRFTVSSRKFPDCDEHIVVNLPQEFVSTFYKGEDYIQCKYVINNIVYQFGGEIIKIIYEHKAYIIIKKPVVLRRETHRAKQRVLTQILCEYFVERVIPGEVLTRMQGFAVVKDANTGGISFLTTDEIPHNTVLKMVLNRSNIVLVVEIMNFQRVNDKNFYGSKILRFENNSESNYKKMLESIVDKEDLNTFVGEIY